MAITAALAARRAPGALYTPDETTLRKFGLVRAVGGGAYLIAAIVLAVIYGWDAWPLLLGAPVLAIVTTVYFLRCLQYPRTSVAASLVADAVVLGAAAAFVGGTGSGTAALHTLVIVSGGIVLGPAAAYGYTALGLAAAWLQLLVEELGAPPAFLHRPDLGERVQVLLIISAVLVSVGYLTATYASVLQRNLARADRRAEKVRQMSTRRRSLLRQAMLDIARPLGAVEQIADALDRDEPLDGPALRELAAQLRQRSQELQMEAGKLADVGALDEVGAAPTEPIDLSRIVQDALLVLRDRLADYEVTIDVPEIKVVGDRRAARRIVFNLLENVCDHTPPGTRVWVEGRTTVGQGVLVVTDDGPGIPPEVAARLFDPPDEGGGPRIGLPLVHQLAEGMGARARYEPAAAGGSRFLVGFRLAPRGLPTDDDAGVAPAPTDS